jgi:hypothetical protein
LVAAFAIMRSRSAAVDGDNAMLRASAFAGSSNAAVVWVLSGFADL